MWSHKGNLLNLKINTPLLIFSKKLMFGNIIIQKTFKSFFQDKNYYINLSVIDI